MNDGVKTALVVGGIGVTGLLLFAVISNMNARTAAMQTQTFSNPATGQPAISQEGSIIYGILSGLGVGIGGVLAGNNANRAPSNRTGAADTPATPTQQNNPAQGGYDPSRPIGPGNSPVSGFRFDRAFGGSVLG